MLSAVGEEWGFVGVLAVMGFSVPPLPLAAIALRAAGDYEFFLAAGLAAAPDYRCCLLPAELRACCRSPV